ncbi:MAG: sodium ion-translocating decarboxylase subunit beta, partial [Clostridia bacterium]|nr:sodium ion-translocating decarboxylase subunit beta [Clostridia bacterium]
MDDIVKFLESTGFYLIGENPLQLVMLAVSCVLLYLAIVKKFEPMLLLPIAFGMLLTNLPGAGMYHAELFEGGHVHWDMFADGVPLANGATEAVGLIDILYLGVKLGVYPCLIFMGVGCMTDFAPLIANPKSLLLGAAAQLGIFVTYIGATLLGFAPNAAASIGIIGGADGPTAIYTTSKLFPNLLGPIA